jgi:hypothetical protein
MLACGDINLVFSGFKQKAISTPPPSCMSLTGYKFALPKHVINNANNVRVRLNEFYPECLTFNWLC